MADGTFYIVQNAGGLYLSGVNRWMQEREAALEFGTADGAFGAAGDGHGVRVLKCSRDLSHRGRLEALVKACRAAVRAANESHDCMCIGCENGDWDRFTDAIAEAERGLA